MTFLFPNPWRPMLMMSSLLMAVTLVLGCGLTSPPPSPQKPDQVEAKTTEVTVAVTPIDLLSADEPQPLTEQEFEALKQNLQPTPVSPPIPKETYGARVVYGVAQPRLLLFEFPACLPCRFIDSQELPRLRAAGWTAGVGNDQCIQVLKYKEDYAWFDRYSVDVSPTWIVIDPDGTARKRIDPLDYPANQSGRHAREQTALAVTALADYCRELDKHK